jgi:transposase
VFQDESGISERPSVRRTWSPRGQTPVLVHAYNWKKLSVAGALAYRWDGRRCQFYFALRPGSYDSDSLIEFLEQLRRQRQGQPTILVWDGLPAHRSRTMQAYLQRQRRWLRVERLPGYAPELNPLEPVWGNVKGRELANLCAADLAEVAGECRKGLRRVQRQQRLGFGFLRSTGLSL